MKYKTNHKKFSVKGRGEYMTKAEFICEYYTNIDKCREFFFNAKWPTGYYCEKCGCTHYYYIKSRGYYRCTKCHHDETILAHTIFQDNKMPLNKLLYGIFLVFSDKRGISCEELSEELKVNYKTACLLHTKCQILMRNSNLDKTLDSSFYESDVAYIGAPGEGKRGLGTTKQAFLVILSTSAEHQYPQYVKLKEIEKDNSDSIESIFQKSVKMSEDRLLNTDGKTTYNCLKKYMNVCIEKIDYEQEDHRLWFLNILVSNLNKMLLGVFHGIDKRMLPLYFAEYEWRFNHRNTKNILDKVTKYIRSSFIARKKDIQAAMDVYALQRGLSLA